MIRYFYTQKLLQIGSSFYGKLCGEKWYNPRAYRRWTNQTSEGWYNVSSEEIGKYPLQFIGW